MDPRIPIDRAAVEAFCRRNHIVRLAPFGSVLRDDFSPESDVDVLVEFTAGHSPSFFGLFDMEDELSVALGGRKIDLRTAEDLSTYFRDEVPRRSTGRRSSTGRRLPEGHDEARAGRLRSNGGFVPRPSSATVSSRRSARRAPRRRYRRRSHDEHTAMPRWETVSLTAGGTQSLALDAGSANASAVYWMLGSASGSYPGVPVGCWADLPLTQDGYFKLTVINPLAVPFGSFLGILDANGRGSASLTVPGGADPGLAGVVLHHAFIAAKTFDRIDYASGPATLTLLP